MKILSIAPYKFLPPKTGGEKGIALFYKFFCRYANITCVSTSDNVIADIKYTVLPLLGNSKLRYVNPLLFFRLRKLIKHHGITHVLMEHPYFGWLGVLLKKTCKVNLIVHSHNIEFQRWKTLRKWWWPILASYEKMAHHNANYNFFKTEEDKAAAIKHFGLKDSQCAVITYGIEWNTIPSKEERNNCRQKIVDQYQIPLGVTIFLFNGSLNYFPNLQAVKTIVEKINPLLLNSKKEYRIIICGKGLPPEMNELKEYASSNIIYTGFVEDISMYFKGADVFINPVTEGGGIQTKLVEALGYNLTAISTAQGAIGIPASITNEKMKTVNNNDWQSFATEMMLAENNTDTDQSFFNHFYWDNIAQKAASFIQS